jgi:methylthioxylose transferase
MAAVADSTTEPHPARPAGTSVAIAFAAVALATVAWGLIADATGAGLGAPLPPFFASWMPRLDGTAVAWIALLGACVAAAVPLARGFGGAGLFVAGATALGLLARLAVAASRGGTGSWYSVFGLDPEAANEYLPALPALDLGLGDFLDRFAELAPSLPIHASAHPPGILLLTDAVGIDGPRGFAALVILTGIAAVPLTYATARRLDLGDGRARAAALMLAFSPAAMLYGVASADALFATLGIAATLLLVAGGAAVRLGGMAMLAVASFFSWALLAIGAFATLLVAQREGLREAAWIACGSAITLAAFYGSLYAITGYDPIGVLGAASEAYDLGISNARPWAFWVLGSPVAFFVALGLPISWYAARALGIANPIAVSLAAVVCAAALLGFSKAETERIWLFMAPLACLAAAALVPRDRVPLVIALLAGQAVLTELAVDTIW